MNQHIFARPVCARNGSVLSLRMGVHCQQPMKYYGRYPYFEVHTSTQPTTFGNYKLHSIDVGLEWLTRDRRTIAFADCAGLTPHKFVEQVHAEFVARVNKAVWLDHFSMWKSGDGAWFVLNEPYHSGNDEPEGLKSAGLIAVPIPTNLSPYCGGWNDKPGAMPRTRSFLIGDVRTAAALGTIIEKLERLAILAHNWNDTRGIHHV